MESLFDFTITPFYYIGMAIWKVMLILIGVTAGETPQAFSEGTWNYITQSLYPLFLSIGSTLLNVFFLIGYLRSVSNLRDGMTLEMFIELCIKVALGNLVIQSIIPIMEQIFNLAGGLSKLLIAGTDNPFVQSDMDGGAIFFYAVFGIIYFAVCLVSSVTIFLTVYGRYLQLYLLVLSAPIALSTIPGGPGISQTAGAWFKTLLAKSFSIVLIALAIIITSKMCAAIDFGQLAGIEAADGFIQALQNIFNMLLLTASVKGVDEFMRRTFAL